MKILLICFLSFTMTVLLMSCATKAISTHETNNPEFKVEVMGDFDGCRIYRFADEKYFVRCQGLPTEAVIGSHLQSCGDSCFITVDDSVQTVR